MLAISIYADVHIHWGTFQLLYTFATQNFKQKNMVIINLTNLPHMPIGKIKQNLRKGWGHVLFISRWSNQTVRAKAHRGKLVSSLINDCILST